MSVNQQEWLESLARLRGERRACAQVVVIGIKGSAPREIGARMIVADGRLAWGTIGGGRLEHMAIERASELAANAPQLLLDQPGYVAILSGRDGQELARLVGGRPTTKFGLVLALIGDQDGDGVPDLATSATHDCTTGTNAGAVWVFSCGRLLDAEWRAGR